MKREKSRVCSDAVDNHKANVKSILCIGLDSKKDNKSLVLGERVGGRANQVFKAVRRTLDHLTFTIESGIWFNFFLE